MNAYTTYKTSLLASNDESITVPYEIEVYADGRAVALHPDSGDVTYDTLAELCAAYEINEDDITNPVECSFSAVVDARKYEDHDDSLSAALRDVAAEHGVEEWRLGAEWVDNNREAIRVRM